MKCEYGPMSFIYLLNSQPNLSVRKYALREGRSMDKLQLMGQALAKFSTLEVTVCMPFTDETSKQNNLT